MRVLLAAFALLAFDAGAAAVPVKCTPPGKPGKLLGMDGCLQPDGSLVTEKGFRIRVTGGGGGAGGGVEIDPPAGSGAAEADRLLERDADALQQLSDQPDAGLERHVLREAARFQREFAEDIRETQENGSLVSSAKAGARAAPAAAPPVPASVEKWCADLLPIVTRANQEFLKPPGKISEQPPVPPPPAADFWDCWGCNKDARDRHDQASKDWVENEWQGKYLELEYAALKAAIRFSKDYEVSTAVQQAVTQPNSACAALYAPAMGLRDGLDGMLISKAIARMARKNNALVRQYGKPQQYATMYPVARAFLGTLKEIALLTCSVDYDLGQETYFIQQQAAEIRKEWERRFSKEKDYRQLSNLGFILSVDKERFLLASEQTPADYIENHLRAALVEIKIDFQVKLAGQSAGQGGYVRARSKGSAELFPYNDEAKGLCAVLESSEFKGGSARPVPMELHVFDAEMYGPSLRNKYLGPQYVKSNVGVQFPCCDKAKPQDKAELYLEALGAQQARSETEQWSLPAYVPFPAIDGWFRLAFNTAALMKSVKSGQADAEAAQMEQDMAARQKEMDDLQARYDRGEASLADLMAGAMKMKEEVMGGGVGRNTIVSKALHYHLDVPFQNGDRFPVKVKLDARNMLRGGGPEAEGILDGLAYGFGDVELKLVNSRKADPPKKTP